MRSTSDCLDANDVLDYLGQRSASVRADVEDHIDRCAACHDLLAEVAQTSLVDQVARPDPDLAEAGCVGRYTLGRWLGEGAMGVVHEAYDPVLERAIAIKLVHPELARGRGAERLLREGRALARLSDPHVVTLHDVGEIDGRVFLAMELVDGITLADWLRSGHRSQRAVLAVFLDAGRGLAAAHRAGIVHRDFKAENVLIGDDGRARVGDFGLAGWLGPSPAHAAALDPAALAAPCPTRLTRSGALLGTPMFMSPEQHLGQRATAASDQFNFCASLYEALCGEPPFGRPDDLTTLRVRVLAGALPAGGAALPRWLRRALERGLSRDPTRRFPSMEELLRAIDPAPRQRALRRRSLGGAALGVAAAAALAAGFAVRPDAVDAGDAASSAVCARAGAARAALWTAADRRAVTAAFAAPGIRYPDETVKRLEAVLSARVGELGRAEAALCEETPRSAEAKARFALGMECLADRRRETGALIGRLRGVEAGGVRDAVEAAHSLAPADECGSRAWLAAELRTRSQPGTASAATRVREILQEGRALHVAGRYPEAARSARRAVELARPIGGGPLATALLALGHQLPQTGGSEQEMEALFREAATTAELAQLDDLRATAMVDLVSVIAHRAGREREALSLEPMVAAAITRSGRAGALRPLLSRAMGTARFQLQQYEQALASFQTALGEAQSALPRDDEELAEYLNRVAVALARLGRHAEALEYDREAVRVTELAYGAHHPGVARYLTNLSVTEAALGQLDRALADARRGRALLAGVEPPSSPENLKLTQVIGTCHHLEGRFDEALAEYRARQRALVDAGLATSAEMATSWTELGDLHRDRREWKAAAAAYHRARAVIERTLGSRDVRIATPLVRLGVLEVQRGRLGPARAALEQAVDVYDSAGTSEITSAGPRFVLAQVLWESGSDRARARALGERARAAYAAAGQEYDGSESQAVEWLREIRPRR
jgi:eukaryotic-like serine/threonine-protein kinase